MGKRVGLMLILAVAVSLLVSTGLLNGVSAPATERQEEYGKYIDIEWQREYGYSGYNHVESATNLIQTSDGGYAYLQSSGTTPFWGFKVPAGGIVKTDSNNNTQWVKNLTYPSAYGDLPLVLSSLIETSDGALAGLGVGNYILGNYDGRMYLVKTEPFLPLPTQTPLPTPILTPSPPEPIDFLTLPIVVAVVAVIGVGLTIYFKKRKH
jgi:hypothetical protein